MQTIRLLIICFSVLAFSTTSAQQTFGGKPYTYKLNTHNPKARNYVVLTNSVSGTVLPPYTNQRLAEYADSLSAVEGDLEYYYGKGFKVHIDLIQKSTRQLIKGMNVYTYRIRSAHAKALAFAFDQFYIPRGGSLYFYRADKSDLYGKLNHKHNLKGFHKGIQLVTPPLQGNDWIIEYNIPASKFQGILVLTMVSHVYR